MKKHPVDDLFKHKLSDLEKQPSPAAWLRIQNKQKVVTRRFSGWVWYAAAGIAAVLFTAFLIWQGQQDAQKYTENAVAGTETPKKAGSDITSSGPVKRLTTEEKQVALAVNRSKTRTLHRKAQVTRHQKPDIQRPDLHNNAGNLNMDVNEVAGPALASIPVEMPGSAALTVIEKEIAPELAAVEENTETRTIVVRVDTEKEDPDEKSKSSRFTKVFRQLKNARAGEPVNWKDVGFNPKIIVARVDEKIKDKEEVISEKYQNLKKRTKL